MNLKKFNELLDYYYYICYYIYGKGEVDMKHAYELTYPNGVKAFSIQDYYFTEDEMLKACKKSNSKEFNTVIGVKYHRHIPNGYHLCGCGNLAKGSRDELCSECQEIYGHTYEHQL